MDISLKVAYLKELGKKFPNQAGLLKKYIGFNSDEARVEVSIHRFTDDMVDQLISWAERDKKNNVEGAKVMLRRLQVFRRMKAETKDLKVRKLVDLAEALKFLIAPLPHKYLFKTDPDGHAVPYFVDQIEYQRGRTHREPSTTTVSLVYLYRRTKKHTAITFYKPDVRQKLTVHQLLEKKGFFLETETMMKMYEEDAKRYQELSRKTGDMFLAVGTGYEVHSEGNAFWWGGGDVAMEREGIPTRVVMDDLINIKETGPEEEPGDVSIDPTFWKGAATTIIKTDNKYNSNYHDRDGEEEDEDDDEDLEDQVVVPPIHPVVKVFDLSKHIFVNIHIGNLTKYKYTPEVFNKLILSPEKKDLIRTLVEGSRLIMEDIIKGKTGGIIVLATGYPGTGKTLTAEVYSEATAKPLYVIQCSQLGVSPDEVEKNLTQSLSRATRWGAILLIDEADVYVHERTNDMVQNAVVGIFLRVLEYYRGILFLTSNRETLIDDAIESRATAHVRYELPTEEELVQIWEVQAEQQKVQMSKQLVRALAKKYPAIPGRSVKNLLKLAKLISIKQARPVDMELIDFVSRFLDIKASGKKTNGNSKKE